MLERVEAAVRPRPPFLAFIAGIGPGILVMLADTDAGNVVTAAQSGAQWGYRLLPLLLGLIPVLYMVQELAVRLAIFTGRGYSELVRYHYGSGWAWVLAAGLVLAVAGSMTTEFAAVAGIGELYGAPRNLTLPMAAATLLIIVLSGSYRRVERTAILIGALELAFLMVAVMTHPDLGAIAHQVSDLPLGNNSFWLLAAALIGAVFNSWMVFYQQSATAEKRLDHRHYGAARSDTALGAVLTQVVSASVLFVAAATLGTGDAGASLASVGQISEALIPHLGSPWDASSSASACSAPRSSQRSCVRWRWPGRSAKQRATAGHPKPNCFTHRCSTASTPRAYWGEQRSYGRSRTLSG